MSQKSNIRRAWLAERIGKGESDAKLIALCAVTFRVEEKTCRKDLNAVYDRWIEIDEENAPMHKARFMELGFEILADMRNGDPVRGTQFGPIAQHFKTLAVMAGVMRDGLIGKSGPAENTGDTRPDDARVRDRLDKLKADPAIRERAFKLGLNLEK